MKCTVIGYWGAYPEQGEATSAYLLEQDGFRCLIDCGSGVLSRLQSYIDIKELDAVVLSHYHQDHIADIGVLQYSWLVQNSLHNDNHMLPIYGHGEDETGFAALNHRFTEGIAYQHDDPLEIGPFQFTFQRTTHPVPCFAMRICYGDQVIVYTGDSSFHQEIIPFCSNADLLISECSFYHGQDAAKAGHMTSSQCGELAAAAGVKQLLLTHLPHFGNRQDLVIEARKKFNGAIQLAYEGWIWQG
ncbi:MBL fold metallo-hydrolase [Sediminibacillus halophilus]|uniref:Ribonuclease BN, tRNA processing enzyme n=1 Tax=Sediminibacillus halophilus TaxID=482461 RepID=A0A1G9PM39_9BACI|nr:MBL fold metallo-hydrolase [Sediminibacillus halophilus]SDL99876.1 Ribonuclease BN, tRNA processing enzyme [Sediminibacillus halophilus]